LKNRLSYWLGTYWVEFDFVYMKPRLVHNWPQVKDDNDNIARRIKEAMHIYREEQNKAAESSLIDAIQMNQMPEETQVNQAVDENANKKSPQLLFKGLTVKEI
jgi:hypothetical protein